MIFDLSNPSNKFGYFKVGEKFCSYSQFEAQEYAAKTGKKVEWNFNEEFFSTIDWTVEPAESLKELYAERARQIRNKHDYLVLYLSGGSDSQNILATFLENNIYIDEILTYHAYEGIKDKFSTTGNMVEITLAAIPEAKKYIEKFPTTIHRIVDISQLIKDYWIDNIKDLKYNFMYYNNYFITPYSIVATNLPTILSEYQRLADAGKNVGFIHGCDKPYIQLDQGKWSFSFHSESIGASVSNLRLFEKTPFNDILFYWDPDAWKLIVKQAHVLRAHLYKNHEIIKAALQGRFTKIDDRFMSTMHLFGNKIPMSVIKNAIYPHWRDDIVNVGKQQPTLLGVRNKWWSASELPGTKEHAAGVQYVMKVANITQERPQQASYCSKKYYF
jgi:hypothetical protein